MLASALGTAAETPVAKAETPRNIINTLDYAFNDNDSPYYYMFNFKQNENGDVVAVSNGTGKETVIATEEECKNISSEELRHSVKGIITGKTKPKDVKSNLKRAAKSSEDSSDSNTASNSNTDSDEAIALAKRIKSMKARDKKKLIADFEGKSSEFNFGRMHVRLAADAGYKKQKLYDDYNDYLLSLIAQYSPKFKSRLPNL